ncbi:MAG: TOTE conflict system archaeo-eukaryotic primase domain-containing protein, partial [Alphaproteobacteria bacterium]
MDITASIAALQERLRLLDDERLQVLAEIETLRSSQIQMQNLPVPMLPDVPASVHHQSPEAEKIALFRSLFRGREDVFPHRWHNAKTGKSGYSPVCGHEWVKGICEKPKIKCGESPNQRFISVSDAIIRNHLRGKDPNDKGGNDFIAGVYPLLLGDVCWFLAADFDKEHWQRDAAAFLATCVEHKIPAALERSRSGNGGHVWIFF